MSWLDQCQGYHDNMTLCKRGYCSAKAKYDVYPSAYANLYASSVCQGQAADYGGQTYADSAYTHQLDKRKSLEEPSDLQRWVQEEWVNVCEPIANGYAPCGRQNATDQDYPYCRPSVRVNSETPTTVNELTSAQIQQMCAQKNANFGQRVYLDLA